MRKMYVSKGSYCNPKCPVALPYGGLVGDLGKSGNNQRHGEKKRNRPDPRGGVTPHVPELSVVVNVSHCDFGVMNTIPAPDLAIEVKRSEQCIQSPYRTAGHGPCG